tara:strand:- start:5852 stop:6577 length:726 start_codon:yes stop_codon:yes gene_type:complete
LVTQNREGIVPRIQSIVGEFPVFSGDNAVGIAQVEEGLDQAIRVFSKQEPRIVVEDETGDGGRYYALSDLAEWEDDFSLILSIDWDVGTRVSSDELPLLLVEDDGEWKYYRDSSIRYFYFPKRLPTSSITFRVTYNTVHTLSAETSTIPKQYEEAIIYLAISELSAILSFHTEKASDPPSGAEFVTMRNKGSGFREIGKMFWEKYIREMGGEGVPGASKMRDFDQRFLTGEQYLFHSGLRR